MPRGRHHSHGKKSEHAHTTKEDHKAEREQHDGDSEQNDQAADGQINRQAQPATYTAIETVEFLQVLRRRTENAERLPNIHPRHRQQSPRGEK